MFFASFQTRNQDPVDFVYELLKLQKALKLEMTELNLIQHVVSRLEPQVHDYVDFRNLTTRAQLKKDIRPGKLGVRVQIIIGKDEIGMCVGGLPMIVEAEIGGMQKLWIDQMVGGIIIKVPKGMETSEEPWIREQESVRQDNSGFESRNEQYQFRNRGPTTRGLLATDHVILNHGQVTWTTPELAPPLLTTTPHQREDVSALDRFNVHRCPTRRVFSGTGLELMTYLPWSDTLTTGLPQPTPASRMKRYRYILIITDHFSKWLEVIPLKKASAKIIADTLFENYTSRYGAPVKIISDNGPQFISEIFEHLNNRLGIQHVKTVVYRPQSNRTERVDHDLL
ncbi:uncharacterized protein TNCV_489481 [Trichonephila clavipes]|nr:uncharacterized protein TNCV_489481 [Trichonephila clavipes]